MAKLSERLLRLRTAKKLRQEDIAREGGVGFSTYRRYETGERDPSVSTLWKLADFYGVTVDYLIGRSDEK